ncbi:rRNA methyltransferase [Chloroflexia bacterium SDU3-3]|nr:rRNA methyltransferase [Chloroflexia bacterium SDU3-3]
MLTLPDDLAQAIRRQLDEQPEARWVREAQALSERYRGDRRQQAPLASGEAQALGYMAMIMPATYAQLRGAMAAAAARAPGWQPHTALDLGSGPGTALWAATAQWPSLARLEAWEREGAFIRAGRQLASQAAAPALQSAAWHQRDLRSAQAQGSYDLVILGHVLNELTPEAQAATVAAAWTMTAGLLLIVEPGTSAAFPVVRAARDALLGQGAHTLAPCAHDMPCPLADDWCHFPQRIARPEFQRRARGAPSPWEDSKFSYAAMARFPAEGAIWGRVIREVAWNKAYAETTISSRDGIIAHRALKRHRAAFKQTKELGWGQALDEPPHTED